MKLKRIFALAGLSSVLFLTLILVQLQAVALQTFTISGQITQNGGRSGLDGVTVLCADGISTPIDVVSTGGGYYTCTVAAGWSGTVTPTSTQYTFSPISATVANISSNITQDFAAVPIPPAEPLTISGVTNQCSFIFQGKCYFYQSLGDVTLLYDGGTTISGQFDGIYSISVPQGWSGTVTPVKTGYVFSPTLITYSALITHQLNQTFTGEITATTYSISGKITDSVTANGVDGVQIIFNDGVTTTTASGGLYSRSVGYNWYGTVTPVLAGATFSPTVATIGPVTSNVGQNFIHSTNTQSYTISGIVSAGSGARTGLDGVIITFDNGTLTQTVTTTSGGFYSHTVTAGWYGTVSAAISGYTIDPISAALGPIASNVTRNFTATAITLPPPPQYTISGMTKLCGLLSSGTCLFYSAVGGIPVNYSGGSTISDEFGNYVISVDPGWTGAITPNLVGYVFAPTTRSYTNLGTNITGADFSGDAVTTTFTISGNITDTTSGLPVDNVLLNFVQPYTASEGFTATTDANGFYSHTVGINWQGTIQPVQNGYSFTPTVASIPPVSTNVVQDFSRGSPPPPTYCSATGDTTTDFGIVAFDIGTATQASVINGYSDYSGIPFATLLPGGTYNYRITYQNNKAETITAHAAGYIDYDMNTQFDENCVFGCGSFSIGAGSTITRTGSFSVPVPTPAGNVRVRLVTNYDPASILHAPACDITIDGEVEDYSVDIGAYQFTADVSKTVVTPGLVGNTITFSIRISNTAHTPIVTLPMGDTFSGGLAFAGSSVSTDTQNANTITWADIATDSVAGVISPAQSAAINTVFTLNAMTTITNSAVITATDNLGNTITRTATLVLSPPMAATGAERTVIFGGAVTLDGTASQSTNEQPLRAFGWSQTGGTAVTFTPAQSRTMFTAPNATGLLTFTLAVTDSNGFYDPTPATTRINVVDGDIAGMIDPVSGATLVFTGTQTSGKITTTIEIPGGAVSDTTYLVYTEITSPTHPATGTLLFGGRAFTIDAYQGITRQNNFSFNTPFTITLEYPPDAVAGLFEAGLDLQYWNGSGWSSAGITITEHDFVHHRFVATVNHLTEFALFGNAGYTQYIPLLLK